MFGVGKKYNFSILEDGQNATVWFNCTVAEIDGNLIKLDDGRIVNTASPMFGGAQPTDYAPEAVKLEVRLGGVGD